jgi:uncharacterized protein YjbI with pentapeptide repeats
MQYLKDNFTKEKIYKPCELDRVKTYCKFHDRTYDAESPGKVVEQLCQYIKDQLSDNAVKDVECVGYYIPAAINLQGTIFNKSVYFNGAEFKLKANFQDAIFHEHAGFSYAKFLDHANFRNAKFKKEAAFSHSTFKAEAYFDGESSDRQIKQEKRTTFEGFINFYEATFDKKVDFTGSRIVGWKGKEIRDSKGAFTHVNFNDEVHFDCSMYSSSIFPPLDEKDYDELKAANYPPIKFDDTQFNGKARFIGDVTTPLRLDLVSFKGVDLTNVVFQNVKWLKRGRLWRRNIIVDEFIVDQVVKNSKIAKNKIRGENAGFFDEICGIYNQLRKIYETRLSFREASDFYIGDMEMTRRKLWEHSHDARERLTGIVYGMHKYLNLYGESTFIPLAVWSPIIIVLFAILRAYYDGCFFDLNKCDLAQNLVDSFFAYFQFPFQEDIDQNDRIVSVERIISAPILAIAIKSFALTKRFETAIR